MDFQNIPINRKPMWRNGRYAPHTKDFSNLFEAKIKVQATRAVDVQQVVYQKVEDQWILIQLIPHFIIRMWNRETESKSKKSELNHSSRADAVSTQRRYSYDPNNYNYYEDDESEASDTHTCNSNSTPIACSKDGWPKRYPQPLPCFQPFIGNENPKGNMLGDNQHEAPTRGKINSPSPILEETTLNHASFLRSSSKYEDETEYEKESHSYLQQVWPDLSSQKSEPPVV